MTEPAFNLVETVTTRPIQNVLLTKVRGPVVIIPIPAIILPALLVLRVARVLSVIRFLLTGGSLTRHLTRSMTWCWATMLPPGRGFGLTIAFRRGSARGEAPRCRASRLCRWP